MLIGILPERQHPVGFGVVEIHAQRRAGFADGVIAVIILVKNQGQAVVDFGKIWIGLLRAAVLVKGLVPVATLLGNISESKVQSTVVRIACEQSGNNGFSHVESFVMGSCCGFGERCRTNVIIGGSRLGPVQPRYQIFCGAGRSKFGTGFTSTPNA